MLLEEQATASGVFDTAVTIIEKGAEAGVKIITTLAGNAYGQIALGCAIAGILMSIGFAIFKRVL